MAVVNDLVAHVDGAPCFPVPVQPFRLRDRRRRNIRGVRQAKLACRHCATCWRRQASHVDCRGHRLRVRSRSRRRPPVLWDHANSPYGIRLLIGAAVTALEETKRLPQTILMYPMTLASTVAQLVMKMQQDLADLAIKGDAALDTLFPPKLEQPEWATFDEDQADEPGQHRADDKTASPNGNGSRRTEGRFALYSVDRPTRLSAPPTTTSRRHRPRRSGPASPKELDYESLTLAQLRPPTVTQRRRTGSPARLRRGVQGARAVPNSAGQQDHPRERQNPPDMTNPQGGSAENRTRCERWPSEWPGGSTGSAPCGSRPADPDQHPAEHEDRVHGSARPGGRHVAERHVPRDLVLAAPVKLTEGTQVVVCGKPSFFTGRGTFSLRLSEIRAVGVGELLARIERLRRLLAAEGLFDARLKRPLPFLPSMVGLITGRASAAEHDVTTVAATRWPEVRFAIRNTAVQGLPPWLKSSMPRSVSTPTRPST